MKNDNIRVIVQYHGRGLYRDYDINNWENALLINDNVIEMTTELIENEKIINDKIITNHQEDEE